MNKQRMAGSLLVNTAKLATFGVFMCLKGNFPGKAFDSHSTVV